MKKLVIIVLLIICIPFVKATGDLVMVDKYINGKAYSDGELVTDVWAYDLLGEKYIKLDKDGYVTRELKDPSNDPLAQKGKLNIKANVPDNLKDQKIRIIINDIPYNYNFVLDSSNNFEINADVIATTYEISYVTIIDHGGEYPIYYPETINVYPRDTTKVELDYSNYYQKEEKVKEKKENNKKYILYIFGGVAILVVIIIILLYIKAANV